MQDLWNAVIDQLAKVVTPDWGALIALIPVALLVLVVVYLGWIVRRYAMAGPTRRGRIIEPVAPAGVHMPPGSIAPFLVAGAAAILFLGLVFPGPALWIGGAAVVFTLIYWGREFVREYDQLDGRTRALVVAHGAPPEGVHMPGPSFRPFLVSVAAAVLFLGLVFGLPFLLAGLAMLLISLGGWLRDARRDYRDVEVTDRVGHPPDHPAPAFPKRTLGLFALLFVIAACFQVGLLPPFQSRDAGGGTATGSPAPSAGPTAAAARSPGAGTPAPGGGGGSGSGGALAITAEGTAYDVDSLQAPANAPFTIAFTNNDAGILHNVSIHSGTSTGPEVFQGEIFEGVDTRTYQVPPLAAGTYAFVCTVHANMTGTLTVK